MASTSKGNLTFKTFVGVQFCNTDELGIFVKNHLCIGNKKQLTGSNFIVYSLVNLIESKTLQLILVWQTEILPKHISAAVQLSWQKVLSFIPGRSIRWQENLQRKIASRTSWANAEISKRYAEKKLISFSLSFRAKCCYFSQNFDEFEGKFWNRVSNC